MPNLFEQYDLRPEEGIRVITERLREQGVIARRDRVADRALGRWVPVPGEVQTDEGVDAVHVLGDGEQVTDRGVEGRVPTHGVNLLAGSAECRRVGANEGPIGLSRGPAGTAMGPTVTREPHRTQRGGGGI